MSLSADLFNVPDDVMSYLLEFVPLPSLPTLAMATSYSIQGKVREAKQFWCDLVKRITANDNEEDHSFLLKAHINVDVPEDSSGLTERYARLYSMDLNACWFVLRGLRSRKDPTPHEICLALKSCHLFSVGSAAAASRGSTSSDVAAPSTATRRMPDPRYKLHDFVRSIVPLTTLCLPRLLLVDLVFPLLRPDTPYLYLQALLSHCLLPHPTVPPPRPCESITTATLRYTQFAPLTSTFRGRDLPRSLPVPVADLMTLAEGGGGVEVAMDFVGMTLRQAEAGRPMSCEVPTIEIGGH